MKPLQVNSAPPCSYNKMGSKRTKRTDGVENGIFAELPAELTASDEKRFHILTNDPRSYILPHREAAAGADGRPAVAYTGGMARAERAKTEGGDVAPVILSPKHYGK